MEMLFYHFDMLRDNGDEREGFKMQYFQYLKHQNNNTNFVGFMKKWHSVEETGILYFLQFQRSDSKMPKLGHPVHYTQTRISR